LEQSSLICVYALLTASLVLGHSSLKVKLEALDYRVAKVTQSWVCSWVDASESV